jgi:hypothetical protein
MAPPPLPGSTILSIDGWHLQGSTPPTLAPDRIKIVAVEAAL